MTGLNWLVFILGVVVGVLCMLIFGPIPIK